MSSTQEKQVVENFLKTHSNAKTTKKLTTVPTEVQNAVNDLEKSLTKDDPLLADNTFDKDVEKNLKNHRKSKVFKENQNIGNVEREKNDITEKQKRPIPTPRKDSTIITQEDSEVIENENVSSVTKKRRKKKRPQAQSQPLQLQENNNEVPNEIVNDEIQTQNVSTVEANEINQPPTNQFIEDGNILGVEVHNSDHLRSDLMFVSHPVVAVSVVDTITGKLLLKLDKSRRVTSYYENENVSEILPLMTQPYNFKENKSLLPRWNELLIFNEPFNRFITPSTDCKPVLFFVIKDFVTMAKVNNKRSSSNDKGWYNVAWAFLKISDSFGNTNTKRKLRLQLYNVPKSHANIFDNSMYPVYDWWLNHPRVRYPATLYVTIKPIAPPDHANPALRSMFISQPEKGLHSIDELENITGASADVCTTDDLHMWSRVPGQNCKIPNVSTQRFWAGGNGAFRLTFSHRGTLLAVACKHEGAFPIILYKIPSGHNEGVLAGHQQLTYDMDWSKNDKLLLSASGDGTVQVWDISVKDKPVYTLPHPTFVYTSRFHPVAQYIIASGGYDGILRVWTIVSLDAQLLLELEGHNALINSLVFDKTGNNLYTADSAGVVICWDSIASAKYSRSRNLSWSIQTKIVDPAVKGVFINSISLHPNNNKLLLQCRDSTLRLLDTRIHTMKSFTGAINQRQLIKPAITPCGNFVFAGSEDGKVYVWNAHTQDQVAVYSNLGFSNTIHDVEYHPHEHMVAFCSFAEYLSVVIYQFDRTVATLEAGFKETITSSPRKLKTVVGNESVEQKITTSYKFDKVLRSLDEVDEKILPRGGSRLPPLRTNVGSPLMSTWGSTFDSTQDTSKFTSINRSPYQTLNSSYDKPDISLTIDKDGNKSISANARKTENIRVLVLFDYKANRSDELTIKRGDVIQVLHKDSDNWWFGQKVGDGVQGYFPCAYVEEQESTSTAVNNEVLFGSIEETQKKTVHALAMPGGRLQFYSQSESEDDLASNSSSRQRRREKRLLGRTKSILKTPKIVVQKPSSETIKDETVVKKEIKFEESSFIENTTSTATSKPIPNQQLRSLNKKPPTVVHSQSKSEAHMHKISPKKLGNEKSKHRPLPKASKSSEDQPVERFKFLKSVQSLLDKDLFADTVIDGHINAGYVADISAKSQEDIAMEDLT